MKRSQTNPYIIVGVGGGTASGKTTFVKTLAERATAEFCTVLPLDWYYKDYPNLTKSERDLLNFDHPESLEASLLAEHVKLLKEGIPIKAPQYDFSTHSRSKEFVHIEPTPLLVIEGILALHYEELRELYTHSFFVEYPDEGRFKRRLERDIRERGRTKDSVESQWETTVHPMHKKFCAPTNSHADKVIHGAGTDEETINYILGLLSS